MLLAPEYSLEIQARIPAALAAIHTFISIHNPHDQPISSSSSDGAVWMYDDTDNDGNTFMGAGNEDVDERRDTIAQEMWMDYLDICTEQGINVDDEINSDLEEGNGDDDDDNNDNMVE